ncbi:hypothetical protein [Aminipila luticellarii]|uniref:Uncharacterized protein n=1 Tax=Aminipila luticellarii TaxID=2507160 RepID=A0A410PTG4_9FIRM|nr:hypothetical protein [Aminipila luticellarii]QAT42158.1 hypothetical protein EQM06_02315 [Aminipila luticellarii]
MKKFNFKGRKHAVTATCLLVGMFVLTSAVYANYDDARGYTNYKEAVKDLALYQDNFSAKGEISAFMDDKELGTVKATFKMDGDDGYLKMAGHDNMNSADQGMEDERTTKDGKSYFYYPETNTYRVYDKGVGAVSTYRPDMKDATVKKGIRFAELFADTMVGDLKNNFVLKSKDGDNRTYSVNVSGSQIPEIVNAGISLLFTAANDQTNSPYDLRFEDTDKAFGSYYEQQTGEKMTQDMAAGKWDDKTQALYNKFYAKYSDILDGKDGGILYVKADGTYDYYKTYDEYYKNVKADGIEEADMMRMLGDDPYIDNASCDFTLDKEGRLISNELKASMTGKDRSGKTHTITMKIKGEIFDYGKTKVDAFDTTGKKKID